MITVLVSILNLPIHFEDRFTFDEKFLLYCLNNNFIIIHDRKLISNISMMIYLEIFFFING